jgi:hypothetical protein
VLFAVLNLVESVGFLRLFCWLLFFGGGICISLLFGWYELWESRILLYFLYSCYRKSVGFPCYLVRDCNLNSGSVLFVSFFMFC